MTFNKSNNNYICSIISIAASRIDGSAHEIVTYVPIDLSIGLYVIPSIVVLSDPQGRHREEKQLVKLLV